MLNSRLEHATSSAIRQCRDALRETQIAAIDLMASMTDIAAQIDESSPKSALGQFVSLVEERTAEIERLFSKQASVADSFNVVLFGRTGAGKSTLIEALTRGNGRPVSHGESDWTTEVVPKDWESCKVYDTPGVNGWGRKNKREDLEQRARNVVEVADFVLLCFDSQSQQATEFSKVVEWVQQFNKPVIAVLNNRNTVWRFPTRVPVGAARANLSRTVAQHAGNIQDELAAVGLTGVPVIALASKRALFARASLPFEGPDHETLEKHRHDHGTDKLERWSNFSTLEGLLVHCIADHAVALRMGALYDQLRGVLEAIASGMDAASQEVVAEASVIEAQTIEPLLRLLGYPAAAEERQPYFRDGVDVLASLEAKRGRFQAPSVGEFGRFVQQRLSAELGSLRSRSLAEGEEAVAYAFDRGTRISGEQVRARCFPAQEMEDAAQRVLGEAHDFINRRARLAYRDSLADLKARLRDAADVDGSAGAGWKYGSWGLKGMGTIGGIIGALGAFAGINAWNPLGWAAAVATGVAVAGGVVAALFGWAGGRARQRAEQEKLQARRDALANVRRSVHTVYDEFTERVASEAANIATAAAGVVVLPAVDQALGLRSLASASERIAARARELSSLLPKKSDPQRLVWSAKESCERQAFPGLPDASAKHWLGESWVEDPDGLRQPVQEGAQQRTGAYDPGLLESLFAGFRDVWAQVTSAVSPGAGRRWLDGAAALLDDDELAGPVLTELRAVEARGRPRLHLVGDYNAGKSSFIKRLLLDAGQSVPPELRVRANPTTDREHVHEWGAIDLVDTPGFQSTNESHTEAARRSFPDASALLYLFQPNLVIGDDASVRLVLRGDRAQGLVPKAPRTFFIVNRSDELGVDPVDNPTRYRELAQRKQRELSEALASRGISVAATRVLCMASDPFGMVGDRDDAHSSAYDAHRTWDGFTQFMRAFRGIESDLLRTGVDRSLLEGGLARIARLDTRRAAELEVLNAQASALGRLLTLVTEQRAEGRRLVADHHAKLLRRVEEHAASLRDEVLSERDPTRLKLKAESFGKWWEDKALAVELEQWGKDAQHDLEGWRARTEEAITRRLASAEFRSAFPAPGIEDGPGAPSDARGRSWFHDAFDKAGRFVGAATRDVVYGVGKYFGLKFKPWGAVKLARTLGKAGAVMAVIGVVWDVVDIFWEEHRQAKREEARQTLAKWLAETVPVVVRAIADGDDEEPGLLRAAEDYLASLDEYAAGMQAEVAAKQSEVAAVEFRRGTYSEIMERAEQLLGGNIWECT